MSNRHGHHWIRDKKRRRIYERDGWRCIWCQRCVRERGVATLDHVLPRDKGGTNDHTNLVTACHLCNSWRRHKPAVEFAFALPIAAPHVEPHAALERVIAAMAAPLP